ncbi:hypothetical protein P4O66_007275 [Electrophorus voltai]|uniref:Cohesin subunit SA n=1 Tax=Electrophorus voltai TaxID=2609070 RepID=A0AAD8ZID6_9TELE|nr:hypothetical protein P4O66_007275 [Electrophorus voltai]
MDDVSEPHSDFTINVKATKRKPAVALGTAFPKKRQHRTKAHPPTSSSPSQPDTPGSPITANSTLPQLPELSKRQKSERGKKQSNAVHMYEAVQSGQSAFVTVVDDWLEGYKQDREEGLLELINFVVQCCGCKGVVTREMFNSMQNADIISHLTKEFNEDSVSYPLVASGTQGRRFREALCEFPSQLVQRCQNSLLYDEFLFSSLLAFLTGLADSQVRSFRHTSTLIAMHLMSAIVEVAAVVYTQGEMTQRRCQLEKNKGVKQIATEKLEELQNSYNELLEHQEELRSLMNGIFKGVFVHRYRDRVPEIRVICMKEMGVWLRENPTSFLNDGHLKYMGWMLNDKQASVRLQCVLALQKLYAERSFISRLELFTSRFKERMLNMVMDKDPDVAVEAVKLLLVIKQRVEDCLTEEECSSVYPLVFAAHRGLASAAGEFLYHVLCTELGPLSEGEHEKHSAAFLNLLTCFFIQSKYHEHAAYLVDSLWNVAGSELTDWNTMTSLLLYDKGAGQGLEDAEEGALIDIMMSAVRQAAEATGPTSHLVGKRNLSVKGRKLQAQERRRITNHFILLLPQLLAKYSSDAEKVSSLLRAPLYFELEAYSSTGRLEKNAADEDDVYSAATSMKRLAVFSSARDITAWKLLDPCFLLLKTGVESGEIDQELMVSAMRCLAFHLLWERVKISHVAAQADKAFVCLCDVLLVFGQQKVRKELQSMNFSPDDTLKAEMASFVMDYIFTDPDNDITGEDEDEITSLQRRRNQLAGYCKLILFGVLELRAAADIFKCYNKFYRDYGDLIKETLSKSRIISPVESAKVVCLSLQQVWFIPSGSLCGSNLTKREEGQNYMKEIKDLAKKFAMSFGINLQHIRRPLLELHHIFNLNISKKSVKKCLSCTGLRETPAFSHDTPAKKRRRVEGKYKHTLMCMNMLRAKSWAPSVGLDFLHGPVRSLDTPALTSTALSSRTAHKKPLHRSTGSYRETSLERSSVDDIVEGLSLIEEDFEEVEEPVIEDYEDEDSDFDEAVTLVRKKMRWDTYTGPKIII